MLKARRKRGARENRRRGREIRIFWEREERKHGTWSSIPVNVYTVWNSRPTVNRWRHVLPAPHNITLYKGAIHIVASRAFVDFVLHAPSAQDFLRWCQKTRHPDEHFFNSLNRNAHLHPPGGYYAKKKEVADFRRMRMSLARYKNWVPKYHCPGKKVVRGICILNVLDLPMLYRRPELFANKFHASYSRLARRCLAEELHNRTRDQALGRRRFNVTLYEQFVLRWQTN